MAKRILLAPNNFKGSLSAENFRKIAERTLKNTFSLPVSDGGDGIIDVFKYAYPKAREYKTPALNAVYETKRAPFLILPHGKTCIIETAKICGLGELAANRLNPLHATSFGIGQVIKAAVKKGAKIFYIGLGGVACSDGGAGMGAAVGIRFLDAKNRFIALGAKPLLKLRKIVPDNSLNKIKIFGLADVENPLLGKTGSARVYGPQKGASKKQTEVLENALKNYAKVIKNSFGLNVNKPRCGAAGAIAAGLYALTGAELLGGSQFVLNKLKAEEKIKKADLVITGEGKLDRQTFYGKAPALICKLAKKHKKPVVFVCGASEIKNKNLLNKYNIKEVIELASYAPSKALSVKNPAKYLKKALKSRFL
jgi:glycerate kinase